MNKYDIGQRPEKVGATADATAYTIALLIDLNTDDD